MEDSSAQVPESQEVNDDPGAVTKLLHDYQAGNKEAFERLIERFLPELEEVARICLRTDAVHDFMQTQSLVQEYCLKLIKTKYFTAVNSKAFRSYAFKEMRRLMIGNARHRRVRIKMVSPDTGKDLRDPHQEPDLKLDEIWLDRILAKLDEESPGLGCLAALKYEKFTNKEIGEELGLSTTGVDRRWKKCKAFILAHLQEK